jgi:hypothetical protein
MRLRQSIQIGLLIGGALILGYPAAAQGGLTDDDRYIRQQLGSLTGDDQARALTHLVWSEDDSLPASPAVSANARQRLLGWGKRGMPIMREAMDWAHPRYSADIIACVIEAEASMKSGRSNSTNSTIDAAIWFGSTDAIRIAMAHYRLRPHLGSMLPIIDTAYDHPQLRLLVIESLRSLRSDKARFFLAEVLESGTAVERLRAADAMAHIGGRCLEYLRGWSLSDDPELRSIAVSALLPVANIADLTTLYEYIGLYPDEDPKLLARLITRAQDLEAAFEAQQEIDSASPALDD